MPQIKRQTAYLIWISSIVNASFIKKEGEFEPNFIRVNGKDVSRVNIIATITNKYENEDKTFTSVSLDDGSAVIRAKTWREDTAILSPLDRGDIVRVIGKIRNYNDETYITPEIIKKVDPNWEIVHKLCLIKTLGKPQQEQIQGKQPIQIIEEETIISESDRQKILSLIEKLDKEEGGADRLKLAEHTQIQEDTLNLIIEELLKEGEIFEIKGQLKTMN